MPPQEYRGPDNEPDVPLGEYRLTCNGCKLITASDKLYCSHCPQSCGKRVPAMLKHVSECKASKGLGIFNHDGKLVCEDALPENVGALPEGSYVFSCHGCFAKKGMLKCTACLDGVGDRHHTSIPLEGCCEFGNSAGKLECARLGNCHSGVQSLDGEDDKEEDEQEDALHSKEQDSSVYPVPRHASEL